MEEKVFARIDIISLVIFVGLLVLFLNSVSNVNASNEWNWKLASASIGFLAAIIGWGAYALNSDIKSKRDEFILMKWKFLLPKIEESVSKIQTSIRKSEPDSKSLLKQTKLISENFEEIKSHEQNMNFDLYFLVAIMVYIFSAVLFIFDSISGYIIVIFGLEFYFRSPAYALFLLGIWNSVLLLLTWFKLIGLKSSSLQSQK